MALSFEENEMLTRVGPGAPAGEVLRRCYHGWLYDIDGRVLEMPGEPPDSTFGARVRHPAYRVQELAGMIFAYLGPEPAPLLPRYDVLVRDDGIRSMSARIVHCFALFILHFALDIGGLYESKWY